MRRITLLMVTCVLLTATGAAWQDSGTGARKSSQKAPVDCSRVGDSQITQDVKARIANSALKDFTINVETSEGEVTLTGGVKTGAQKGTATRMTKAVSCVKKVVNQLTVEPSQGKKKAKA